MTTVSSWLDNNSRYLSACMVWLRLLLEQRLELDRNGPLAAAPSGRKKQSVARDVITEADARSTNSLSQRIADAAVEMQTIEDHMSSPPALVLLGRIFGLSKFERDVLLLCASPEFDNSLPGRFAGPANGATGIPEAMSLSTFGLALTLFEKGTWDALSPERPLRYWQLLELPTQTSQALTSTPLRVQERILDFLKGLNRLDDRLTAYLTPMPIGNADVELPSSQQAVSDAILAVWQRQQSAASLPIIQLLGSNHASKALIAANTAAALGLRIYQLSADGLPGALIEIEQLARIWQRESMLLPLALFVDAQSWDSQAEAHAIASQRFLSRISGLSFLAVREAWSRIARESRSYDVTKPTREEQCRAWQRALGSPDDEAVQLLASQFNLNLPDIARIAEESEWPEGTRHDHARHRLWDNCLMRVRPLLDTLAHRIDARATWSDIVLPEQQERLLRQISSQVRGRFKVYEDWGFAARMNRGFGITALFTGDSGVGKTMAAEVVANDLRLNLYRIDLSSVVSKYIGETEKNLCKLFDAAEDGGAILFFDEADSLFGKRSEVKDSHDRYANIEVNYLLQRMESYSGLAILATNMRSALDAAFTRRLRFIVNFPFPSVADRERMWKKAFPLATPVLGLDYNRLAKFNLTGGSIANVAINAAFLAATQACPVTMPLTLAAIRQEYMKLDRPLNESSFVGEHDFQEEAAPRETNEQVA